jgi:LL-diaminopimelate aminotransferase
MDIKLAERLKRLPPYLFVGIDEAKQKALKEGRPVIDLGIGDPDTPTPGFIIDALNEAVRDPENHHYPSNKGLSALREEMAAWYLRRFNVKLDPETEILPLMGSKDGVSHIPQAFIDPGDGVLVPDPGYPPYSNGTLLAGGQVHLMPLKAENGFLPDLDAVDPDIASGCRLMHVNYPNNPTGAVCDRSFFEKVVEFAQKNDIIVCSDAAYTEMSFNGYVPPSFLEVPGAKETGIEFHSLSKTFNMTGWRIGMAVGNRDVISGLARIKSNVDSGVFQGVQHAAIAALRKTGDVKARMRDIYTGRLDTLVDGLTDAGWDIERPLATFYVWAPVLEGYDSMSMTKAMLEKADIIVTPGVGFGESGEGYIRMALTRDKAVLAEAVERIRKAFFR